jgi:1-deoxy-D-xylulose-5-phosphate reductoisomerase
MKKTISVLGSTGSIGKTTLDICRHFPNHFQVNAIAAKSNIDLLEKQAKEFHPKIIAVFDKKKALALKKRLLGFHIVAGIEGLIEAAITEDAELIVAAMVGTTAILPIIEGIKSGKKIALANKEILVSAGELIMTLAKKKGVDIIPIDSEHSAIFQCLQGEKLANVSRILLTASGGPFREYKQDQLKQIYPKQALHHPTWKMGPKNTIDSSTLMNKGLELIEAHFLFKIPYQKIEIIVHPQSIIHSMVEFLDGNIIAQLSATSMFYPIQFALSYPCRFQTPKQPFDFTKNLQLEFHPVDLDKFKCLTLAYLALEQGGNMPCYMNAANEVLVERFLKGEIAWLSISEKLHKLMSSFKPTSLNNLNKIIETDAFARAEARSI